MALLHTKLEGEEQMEGFVRLAILVGGLKGSGKSEFIDSVMETCDAGPLCPRTPNEETTVHCSDYFPFGGSEACFLRLPCLCDQFFIRGRILAEIADNLTNMKDSDKVSSFVYLVNDSQPAEELETHEFHLQLWSKIFGMPPEPEAPKFLVASSLLDAPPEDIRDLCSTWKNKISGTEVKNLMPHREAEDLMLQAVSSGSQMIVQLRVELLRPVLLRNTTVGRHYVEVLKKRRMERRMELLEPRSFLRQLLGRRQDPDGGRLKTELRHWKKCRLPQKCENCLFLQRQN